MWCHFVLPCNLRQRNELALSVLIFIYKENSFTANKKIQLVMIVTSEMKHC